MNFSNGEGIISSSQRGKHVQRGEDDFEALTEADA